MLRGRRSSPAEGHLFRPGTFLKIAAKCEVCAPSYGFADPADGPAFFSMMVMAFPATGFALWLDMKYEPLLWVHLVTSLPLLLLLCILPLRPLERLAGLLAILSQSRGRPARGTCSLE